MFTAQFNYFREMRKNTLKIFGDFCCVNDLSRHIVRRKFHCEIVTQIRYNYGMFDKDNA